MKFGFAGNTKVMQFSFAICNASILFVYLSMQVRVVNPQYVENLVHSYANNVPDILELTVVPDRGMEHVPCCFS